MAGTVAGNRKARETMIRNMGGVEAYNAHKRAIGALGGRNGRGPGYRGGFAHPDVDPRAAGAKGGRISRRTKKLAKVAS